MNKDYLHKSLHFIFLLTVVLKSYGQDTTVKYSADTALSRFENFTSYTFQMPFDYLDHRPDENDERIVKTYGHLSRQIPDSNNYKEYYSLACSLWELNKLKEAEKLFLIIINSNEDYYAKTDYHSSDIPGDFTTGLYGYGSFSSNYKNDAAIYLTKIYIEQKQFEKAFSFLENATKNKKYKTSYSCGTAYKSQQDEYDFLYACIYKGQKKYGKVMTLLLPECLTRDDKIIAGTIKKLYSREQIKEQLQQAEKSIQCTVDTVPSFSYLEHGNSGSVDTLVYYSGTATISLFNKVVTMPEPELQNGERVTKARFLKEFKESSFYYNLTNEE